MTKLLNGNDINFLVGKKLNQLALGSYEFQLNFEAEVSISVGSTVHVSKGDGTDFEIEADNPEQTKHLVFLLAKIVTDFQPSENQDLMLLFDDGSRVTIRGSNGLHEAYVIWNKGDYVSVPAPPPHGAMTPTPMTEG